MEIKITNVKDAIELMELCGYPVREVRWVTWGGGALQDCELYPFDDDEELIEFAEAMRKCVDDQITEIENRPLTNGISKTVNQHGEEKINWGGGTCRARCGLCTAWIEKELRCGHNNIHPVFYNTPTFGCNQFDDTCEDIRGQETDV